MKQPENKERDADISGEWCNTCKKFTPQSVSSSRTIVRPHKDKLTIHLGSRTYYYNECNQRRDGESTHLKILWSQAENFYKQMASCKGLGACLLQDGHPIYFVSKSLSDAEKGYVAMELEALAVSWGLWEIPSFSLWLTLHLTDGSKTPGINTGTFSQWSKPPDYRGYW